MRGTLHSLAATRHQSFAAAVHARASARAVAPRPLAVRAASGPASAPPATEASSSSSSSSSSQHNITMLFDGDCPLCMREVEMLQRRDAGKGRIKFVDVASPDYDPAANAGITFERAMERIHAVEADGTVIKDVEVFRRLYEEVGLGWVYAATKFKSVEALANRVYDVWAKYRLPLTGRPDLAVVLQQKKTCAAAKAGGGSQ